MTKVQIVTDSTADIPKSLIKELDIHVVPLKVHFGDETYEDGIDLNSEQFYQKLSESEVMPTTSQPTPYQFEEIYRELNRDHPDSPLISIHLSANLSGTFQSAHLAAQTIGDEIPITVVDSKRASYAIGLIVVEVAELAKQGASLEDCQSRINELLQDTTVLFMVDTMEYLQKNGRIGKASALVGSLLKIKPILSLNEEGEVFPFEKARGNKKAVQRMIDEFQSRYGNDPVHIGISHAQAESTAQELMERLKSEFRVSKSVIADIGPVIGTHVGPGALSVSFARCEDK